MRKTIDQWGRTVLLLGALGLPTTLPAQPLEDEAGDAPLFAASVPAEDLDGERGGELHLVQLNEVSENATMGNNQANGNITGSNWVGADAFTNANVIGTVIQNTGNNVIIQDSLIVNISYVH